MASPEARRSSSSSRRAKRSGGRTSSDDRPSPVVVRKRRDLLSWAAAIVALGVVSLTYDQAPADYDTPAVSVVLRQGRRGAQEDRAAALVPPSASSSSSSPLLAAAALYDGHAGALASSLLANGGGGAPIWRWWTQNIKGRRRTRGGLLGALEPALRGPPPSAPVSSSSSLFAPAFEAFNARLVNWRLRPWGRSDGSTALVAAVWAQQQEEEEEQQQQQSEVVTVAAASVGNSRAVLCVSARGATDDDDDEDNDGAPSQPPWTAVPLTLDHVPTRPDEARRLARAAAEAVAAATASSSPAAGAALAAAAKETVATGRLAGELEVSRSFGDAPLYRQLGLSPEPEVAVWRWRRRKVAAAAAKAETTRPELLILATDGVSEVATMLPGEVCLGAWAAVGAGGERWAAPAPTPPRPPAIALGGDGLDDRLGQARKRHDQKGWAWWPDAQSARAAVGLWLAQGGVLRGPPAGCVDCVPAAASSSSFSPPTRARVAAERVASEAVNRGSGDNVGVVVVDVAWLLAQGAGSTRAAGTAAAKADADDLSRVLFSPRLDPAVQRMHEAQVREARAYAREAFERLRLERGTGGGLVPVAGGGGPPSARERRARRLRESASTAVAGSVGGACSGHAGSCALSSGLTGREVAEQDAGVCEAMAVVIVPPQQQQHALPGSAAASSSDPGSAVAAAAADATILASLTCDEVSMPTRTRPADYDFYLDQEREEEDEEDEEDDDEDDALFGGGGSGGTARPPSASRGPRTYLLERVVRSSSTGPRGAGAVSRPPHAHVLPLSSSPAPQGGGGGQDGGSGGFVVVTSHWWPHAGMVGDRAALPPSLATAGRSNDEPPAPAIPLLPAAAPPLAALPPPPPPPPSDDDAETPPLCDLEGLAADAPDVAAATAAGPEARGANKEENAAPNRSGRMRLVGRGGFGEVWRARRRRRQGEDDDDDVGEESAYVLKRIAGSGGARARRSALREAFFGRVMARAAREAEQGEAGLESSCRLFANDGRAPPAWGCLDAAAAARAGAIDHVGRFVEAFRTAPLAAAASASTEGVAAATAAAPRSTAPDAWIVFRDEGTSLHDLMYAPLGENVDEEEAEERAREGEAEQLHLPRVLGPSPWWRRQRRDAASSEAFVRSVMAQLLRALAAAHGSNVTHRDVKPENLLVAGLGAGSNVRLIDFGSATPSFLGADAPAAPDLRLLRRLYGRRGPSAAELTLDYSPPELLFGGGRGGGGGGGGQGEEEQEQEEEGGTGDAAAAAGDPSSSSPAAGAAPDALVAQRRPAVDVYAAGVVMLELVLGTPRVFALAAADAAALDRRLQRGGGGDGGGGVNGARRRLVFHLRGLMDACLYPPPPPLPQTQQQPPQKQQPLEAARCAPPALAAALRRRDPLGHGLSASGLDLARKLLSWRPGDRPTAVEALQHPWFLERE